MQPEWVRVRARVTLLTEAEGGRSTPVRGPCSYRPNHNFFASETSDMTVGLIDLPDGMTLELGEPAEIEILFNQWPGVASEIRPGRQWRIQQGHQLVGHGEILELLD